MSRNFYKVLGLPQKATLAEIKKAYRKLAHQYHPDHNPGSDVAQEMLKMINEAYETLSDEQKRRLYDQKPIFKNAEERYQKTSTPFVDPTQEWKTNPTERKTTDETPRVGLVAMLIVGLLIALISVMLWAPRQRLKNRMAEGIPETPRIEKFLPAIEHKTKGEKEETPQNLLDNQKKPKRGKGIVYYVLFTVLLVSCRLVFRIFWRLPKTTTK